MSKITHFENFDMFGVSLSNRKDIENLIDKSQNSINAIQEEIGMLCASTPKDICPVDDGWEPLEYVRQRLSNLFIELEDAYSELHKAYMAETNLDSLIHWDIDLKNNIEKKYIGQSNEPVEYIVNGEHMTPEIYEQIKK